MSRSSVSRRAPDIAKPWLGNIKMLNLLKGCYSALRYSDWARLNLDTLTKIGDREYFVLGNQKTKSLVHIPAFEKLKVLINQDS